MNLIEAIEAGAARVDGRAQGSYISRHSDGSLRACAIGAAYLGCHPDADPAATGSERVAAWCDRLTRRLPTGRIVNLNDSLGGDTWAPVTGALRQVLSPDVLDIDICEAGGG
jgi:hypothetical protein